MRRDAAGSVVAQRVEIVQGSAGRAQADQIEVRQGAIGFARGDEVRVQMGAVGLAVGEQVELRQGFARIAAARGNLRLEQAGAMTVVADRVTMGPRSGAIFVIARRVEGDVRTLFDWRSAAALGLGIGSVLALFRALRGAGRSR